MAKTIIGTIQYFDPKFRFLLAIDPAFEDWRALAAEWYPSQICSNSKATALSAFFVRYPVRPTG
jgi:hypothetical protein